MSQFFLIIIEIPICLKTRKKVQNNLPKSKLAPGFQFFILLLQVLLELLLKLQGQLALIKKILKFALLEIIHLKVKKIPMNKATENNAEDNIQQK